MFCGFLAALPVVAFSEVKASNTWCNSSALFAFERYSFFASRRDNNVSHTVVPLNSLSLAPLRRICWVAETSKHHACVWHVSDVCVTAEEAVGQQGRGTLTAPSAALLGLYRGSLINPAPAWPLALLYLWPSTHRCAHTRCIGKRYWHKDKHTHTHTHKDTDALCMHRHLKAPVCVQTWWVLWICTCTFPW